MKEIKNDFNSFVNDSDATNSAGSALLGRIKKQIENEKPSRQKVLLKLTGLHLAGSAMTLTICPQFGIKLFLSGNGLMDFFMKLSPNFCFVFCGAFYLAATFLLANIFMNYEEWLVLRRTRTLIIASTALLSLGVFMMLSPEVSFYSAVLWLFGASIGAEIMSLRKFSALVMVR
jgi:hypothetical protein